MRRMLVVNRKNILPIAAKRRKMERYAWKAAVLPGKIAEYCRRHDEIWPEMLEMFRRAGIRNYSIWQTGDTLFGYYERDDLQTALAVQKNAPVSAHWRAYMHDVIRMERDPKSGAQPHLAQVFLFDGEIST